MLEADKADSRLSKMKGLMFRTLDSLEGLLMTFDREEKWKIWMLFVPQDLGLIFLDKNKKVVDKIFAEKITLNTKTWKTYEPTSKCKYIIECNPGILDNIELNERLKWS